MSINSTGAASTSYEPIWTASKVVQAFQTSDDLLLILVKLGTLFIGLRLYSRREQW
jgi:hypothetical protein